MADSTAKAEQDLSALRATVATTLSLISKLQESSTTVHDAPDAEDSKVDETDSTATKSPNLNVLDLAHDAASLIRAHSTKLSLLIINKPFTATAVSKVLRELASGPLPGLATAVELCDPEVYTMVMRLELQWRVKRVFAELAVLIREIPLDGQILSVDQKNGTGSTVGKGSLASTGVVWETCDSVIALKSMGIAGLVIHKAEQYRDTLKDALEELKEWGEEEDDEDEDEDEDADENDEDAESSSEEAKENDIPNAAQDAIDTLFASQRHIPRDDPDKVRDRLDSALKRLKLITLMFQAVAKRRFKTLPTLPHPALPAELAAKSNADPGIIRCLDAVMKVMKKIPDVADEMANAFYELDNKEIDRRMDECFFTGFATAELLVKNWEGEKDDFSTWVSLGCRHDGCGIVGCLADSSDTGIQVPAGHEERLVDRQIYENDLLLDATTHM